MRVAIIGGEGFIGKALQRRLSSGGIPYLVFDSLYPRVHKKIEISREDFIQIDFCNHQQVKEVDFTGFDEIYFLIAETSTGSSLQEMTLQIQVSLQTLANFLEQLSRQKYKPKRIILTSSRAVYGEGSSKSNDGKLLLNRARKLEDLQIGRWDSDPTVNVSFAPNCSDQQTKPVSVYGDVKLMQEMLLRKWCEANDTKLDIFRLQNVVGPGQSISNPYTGFLTGFIKFALKGQLLRVFEGGGIVRDLVHVDDVAEVLVKSGSNRVGTEIYDVGTGAPLTLLAIANEISSQIPGTEYVVTQEFRHGDVRIAFANIEKVVEELNWSPTRGLKTIILDSIAWVKEEIANDR